MDQNQDADPGEAARQHLGHPLIDDTNSEGEHNLVGQAQVKELARAYAGTSRVGVERQRKRYSHHPNHVASRAPRDYLFRREVEVRGDQIVEDQPDAPERGPHQRGNLQPARGCLEQIGREVAERGNAAGSARSRLRGIPWVEQPIVVDGGDLGGGTPRYGGVGERGKGNRERGNGRTGNGRTGERENGRTGARR